MNLKKLWKKSHHEGESLRAFARRSKKSHPELVAAFWKGKKDACKTAVRKPRISQRAGKILGGKQKAKKEEK